MVQHGGFALQEGWWLGKGDPADGWAKGLPRTEVLNGLIYVSVCCAGWHPLIHPNSVLKVCSPNSRSTWGKEELVAPHGPGQCRRRCVCRKHGLEEPDAFEEHT